MGVAALCVQSRPAVKLYELRRALQDALDDDTRPDEDRELSQADVDRLETKVRRALVAAYLEAGRSRRRRARK